MFRRKSDIYFDADDAQSFLPWLVAIMGFLATLFLCLAIGVQHWVGQTGSDYAGRFTVHVPAGDTAREETLEKVRGLLANHPAVEDVMQLSVEEVGRLLEPWLGAGMKLSELPIPVVFEVSLKPAAQQMDYEPLRRELQAIDETIELDSHELWVAAFAKFSTAMRGMTVALSLLILGGMGLVVSFSSRAALKLHARTVALLHSIGAEDSYVTRLFQKEALRQVLPGAFFGCIVAGGAYAIAGAYMATLNIATLPKLNFGTSHVALMLVMPAACGLVAWVVAQISVTRQLERTL